MSRPFLFPPVSADANDYAQDAFDQLEAVVPGWEPAEGNLDVILLETVARMAAVLYQLTGDVSVGIFRWFGYWVVGLKPIDAVGATTSSSWTLIDDAGHTIPEGTHVAIASGDDQIVFETVEEVIVPEGTTTVTQVQLIASEPGTTGNDLTADPELIDQLAFVDSITTDETTGGGVDAELDSDYLDRLVANFQLFAPRPIIPSDFAVMAQNVAGVERATAIDLYNPADDTYDNERMVTVALVDTAGSAVPSGVKTAVDDDLQARREVNFIVNVIDPTYTNIHVTTGVVARKDWDTTAVDDSVTSALTTYLSPAHWGDDEGRGDWRNVRTVRFWEIVQVINDVSGVDYISSLTLNGGTANVSLTGPAPLTRAGTITVTVTAGTV